MNDFRQAVVENPYLRTKRQMFKKDFYNAFSFLEEDAARDFNGEHMKSLRYLEDVNIDWTV